jgi:hypothetical protein
VDDKAPAPIVIPHAELSGEALRGVVESVVLREGTDYGEREFTFEDKVAHVLARLKRGEAQILFEPDSQTVQIVVVQTVMAGRGSARGGP